MYFATALINDSPKVIVADKTRKKFFYLDKLAEGLGYEPYFDMIDFINEQDDELIAKLDKAINSDRKSDIEDISTIPLSSAIPYPLRNVICLGKNYKDHIAEVNNAFGTHKPDPAAPMYFTKAAMYASGPNDEVSVYANMTGEVDYEVELIVVIGKAALNVEKKDAQDYIFGYAVGNDFSVRDIQSERKQWFFGKSFDGHFAMGSWIAHKSLFPFPVSLPISLKVNGETRQDSNTGNMIHDIPTTVADLTRAMTLYPGDMIMTGTPAGVGMGRDPKVFLKAGDVVTSAIEGIESFDVTMS